MIVYLVGTQLRFTCTTMWPAPCDALGMNNNCTMSEFISSYAKSYKIKDTAKNMLTSLAVTAAINVMTIPLGFRYLHVRQNHLSAKDVENYLRKVIFLEGVFKEEGKFYVDLHNDFLDRIPTSAKQKIVDIAMADANQYREFALDSIRRILANQETANTA